MGRAFSNTGKLLTNPRIKYSLRNLFYDNRTFSAVSKQYWRVSGGANGNNLHHLFFQNQSQWIPQGIRNSGLNLLELPASINNWAGGRLGRELAIRGGVVSTLGATGYGSARVTQGLMD
ncbi:hypothetical protein NIES23_62420 (plasmid) [Trichormus variabilis NIES-23]|uniref:Uncharacterized protein n=1 Tax=Trichormus variabilis NIES-23 TaxID=1973479 RepID=A0A1Z4KWS1_ANAVA|nr:hypothetical protein NIES23_62420 [Trichormus variabilis NIES-23]